MTVIVTSTWNETSWCLQFCVT